MDFKRRSLNMNTTKNTFVKKEPIKEKDKDKDKKEKKEGGK